MAVEVRPFGVACNIGCRYCYQTPQRDAGNIRQAYDLGRMFAALEKEAQPVTLFGGEPLVLPLDDLERIFRWSFERHGRSGVQTNGILIGDEHIRLFRQYNVDVGVSIDGPDELNDLRWDVTLERTRAGTAQVLRNIARLCHEHRPPGLIVTLHRGNATAERLPRMLAWMRELDALGIRSVRLHALEVDSPAMRAYRLTDEENANAFLAFGALRAELRSLRFDVFDEIERSLLGRDNQASCVWRACDPYTTEAVRGVEGNGQSSNCGRTNKDGVDFVKADRRGFERYVALYETPQEQGGCKDCRFFLMCRGQCPGTAIGGDWRNRSEHCGLWKRLFVEAEQALMLKNEVPLSMHPLRHRLEQQLVALWRKGRNSTTARLSREKSAPPARPRSFVRKAFVGDAQRARWEPRFAAIAATRTELAIKAVLANAVPAAVVAVSAPRDVLALHNAAAARGLHTRLLDETRVSIAREQNHGLGIPACCREAAASVWRAANGDSPDVIEIDGTPATNILLRPLGIDLLGYIPCSFDCAASRARGEALLAFARTCGIEGAQWIEEILSWPVEWSALHGIAEIKTAVVKAAHDTEYTATKRTLRMRGRALPADAARGLTFAFREVRA